MPEAGASVCSSCGEKSLPRCDGSADAVACQNSACRAIVL